MGDGGPGEQPEGPLQEAGGWVTGAGSPVPVKRLGVKPSEYDPMASWLPQVHHDVTVGRLPKGTDNMLRLLLRLLCCCLPGELFDESDEIDEPESEPEPESELYDESALPPGQLDLVVWG